MAKSKFFIKAETFVSPAWAAATESFNIQYDGYEYPPSSKSAVRELSPKLDYFVKIDNKIRFYKNGNALVIAVAEPSTLEGLNFGIKELNLKTVRHLLTNTNAEVVYFAYLFTDTSANQVKTVEDTAYFVRRTDGSLINAETLEAVTEDMPMAIWVAFYRIKNTDIFYGVMNNNIVDVTGNLFFHDEDNGIDMMLLTSSQGTFSQSVFNPRINTGATFVGDSFIYASDSKFTIDMLGASVLHVVNAISSEIDEYMPDEEMPMVEVEIETNLNVTKVGNQQLEVNMGTSKSGYIKYRWISGTPFSHDKYKKETLKREFIVFKR